MNLLKKLFILQNKNGSLWAFAALAVVWLMWSLFANNRVQLNKIQVNSPNLPARFSGFRIAHISDLHNTQFGKQNAVLLEMIRQNQPDVIVITGDLIDSRRTNIPLAVEFCANAVKIAPVYYVSGNHEARLSDYSALKDQLVSVGIVVLDNGKTQLNRGDDAIVLLGVEDPAFGKGQQNHAASIMEGTLADLLGSEEAYTILLSHRPELYEIYKASGIDLVFSGHAHGGQFRIPFVGGLFAPNQGFLPKYDAGLFSEGETNMVVSRGLGNSAFPLRLHNSPEIVLVTLQQVR